MNDTHTCVLTDHFGQPIPSAYLSRSMGKWFLWGSGGPVTFCPHCGMQLPEIDSYEIEVNISRTLKDWRYIVLLMPMCELSTALLNDIEKAEESRGIIR